MDFTFTEEQRLLRESLAGFLADRYTFEARHKAIRSEAGWNPEIWRALAQDLGVLGAALPEDLGGLGGGPVDTLVVMEELGRALVVEPYLETVVIGAGLLKRAGAAGAAGSASAEAVGRIIEGEMIVAPAFGEPASRFDAADVSTTARRDGASWRLDGRKAVVTAGPWASHLLVTARTSGGQRDEEGVSLFLVDRGAPGIVTRDYPTVDGRRACEVSLDGVTLGPEALIGEEGEGSPLIEQVLDEARAALCAEALGVMSQLQAQTLDYAKQRRQFGQPLAEFQVLQHRLVDMFIQLEQSVSMTYMATLKLDLPSPERMKAASAAKAFVGRSCRFVGQGAVQTHGGIGITEELPLSHYFKRATMIESELGSVDFHLARYQALTSSKLRAT